MRYLRKATGYPFLRQTEDLLLSIVEKGNHFVLMSVEKDVTSGREQLFLEEGLKDFENKKT